MANFEKAPLDVQEILSKPIQQLGLKLEGSPLERFVHQLYKELEAKGLKKFRPKCYLTDEWGCPNMEPVIGIPFYLADPKLQRLESEMNDIEDSRQIMMYMRHEAGHAFNYAYELMGVKSPSEFVELSTAHTRKQFEAMTAQTKELTELAQKVTTEIAEPLKAGVTKAFNNRIA